MGAVNRSPWQGGALPLSYTRICLNFFVLTSGNILSFQCPEVPRKYSFHLHGQFFFAAKHFGKEFSLLNMH